MRAGADPGDDARYPIEADAEFDGQAVEAPYLGGAAGGFNHMGSFEDRTGAYDIPDYGGPDGGDSLRAPERPPTPPAAAPPDPLIEAGPGDTGGDGPDSIVPARRDGPEDASPPQGGAEPAPRGLLKQLGADTKGFFSELVDAKPFFDADGNGRVDPWELPGAGLIQFEGQAKPSSGGDTNAADAAQAGASPGAQGSWLQKLPLFMILQTSAVLGPWVIEVFKHMGGAGGDGGLLDVKVGLETLFPGATDLRLTSDCEDYRGHFWRWFTYQWTHVGIGHVVTNTLVNLTIGVALEGFHGTWTTALIFNLGVFGGAMCYRVLDAHESVVGMSAGCYALMGMFLATTLMNWRQMKYPRMRLLYSIAIVVIDFLQASLMAPEEGDSVPSHTVHFGGYIAGLLLGVTHGRNLVLEEWERTVKWAAAGIAAVLVIFCFSWGLQWAPRSIFESEGWCWARQVSSQALFGDDLWHCVRCASDACIQTFAQEPYVSQVSISLCDDEYGWREVSSR